MYYVNLLYVRLNLIALGANEKILKRNPCIFLKCVSARQHADVFAERQAPNLTFYNFTRVYSFDQTSVCVVHSLQINNWEDTFSMPKWK